MRKLFYLFCLILAGIQFSNGQTVQWASKVLDFSSELTPIQYSAQQALGQPNVLPAGGQNPGAWTPDKPKRSEFIKLGYDKPIEIQQIAIAESYNPGALYRVYVYDEAGREYLINTFNPMAVPLQGRMLNVFVEKTKYKVSAVKLEFDGSALPDYFSLDAVAISDSNIPIIANIDLPDLLSKGLVVERLDTNVNSDYSEYNPMLSPDGKTLYFSRKNHPENIGGTSDKEDIWYSELNPDGKWSLAKNMGSQFNNSQPNFVNTVAATPDGKAVVLLLGNKYLDKGKMVAGVSISTNRGGSWSDPKPIEIENDYNYNEKANYFLANTRKSLLMSVEREDTQGGRDLYVSFEKNDSTWTEPLNLGKVINTVSEETAPFLASDDKTLYFSSNGFSGYGGSDVYMSKRLDDSWTNWSPPENLGPDINTKLDDLFFNIPSTSEFAYYSRGITADNSDIFRVKMPMFMSPDPIVIVKGKLIDAKTGKPIGAKIIYERLSDGKEVGVTYSNPETGEYEIHLPGGQQYGFRAEAKDYISESQNLDLRDFNKDGVLKNKDITLAPIEVTLVEANAKITLNNIFFDFDKATLKSESFPELNRIVSLMNENPTMEVEIAGHTDPIGTGEYNMSLSERRAKSVTRYLVSKGISEKRITTSYFGETQLIDTTNTPAGNRKNRRVEFKILKM
ncbi:MAG: OmpA family protein [Cyclobacteriaceae bacterium]|jgi:outer membrane protein OmpA-like peptidoglycan-associated protein|nr:OmpA family protein [Cyclobacteriaceae bacterium]